MDHDEFHRLKTDQKLETLRYMLERMFEKMTALDDQISALVAAEAQLPGLIAQVTPPNSTDGSPAQVAQVAGVVASLNNDVASLTHQLAGTNPPPAPPSLPAGALFDPATGKPLKA